MDKQLVVLLLVGVILRAQSLLPIVAGTSSGSTPIAFVTSSSAIHSCGGGGVLTCAVTSGASLPSGVVVLVSVGSEADTLTTASIADTLSSSYSTAAHDQETSPATHQTWLYCAVLGSSGTPTATITFSASTTFVWVAIDAFTGLTCTTDGVATAKNNNSSPTTGNITTTKSNDLLYSPVNTDSSSSTFTVGSGYILTSTGNGADAEATEYRIVAATGTYNAAMTLSGATSWFESLVAFKGQ